MRLFMIKRKSDKAWLRKVDGHYSVHTGQDKNAWSETPAYLLRTPEGVVANLRKLCSTPHYPDRTKLSGGELEWKEFDESKLDMFEVISIDVDVISMTATPAKIFAQVEAIRDVPLTRKERLAA